MLISIDNGPNQTLSSPYELSLLTFSDGTHNFTIYVFDIANNYVTAFIIFIVDTTAPTTDITSIEGLVELLGDYYIPADASVFVTVTDDDPLTTSTYSWGGSTYTNFTDSFVLTYPDDTVILYINASDELGNENLITFILTIDSLEPTTTFIFPYINSKVNSLTVLEFTVEDLTIETIEEVKYSWDKVLPFYNIVVLDENGWFAVTLGSIVDLYDNGSTVFLYIYAIDIVGNNITYIFSIIIDKDPPTFDLLVYDEENEQWQYINTSEVFYLRGNTSIWCTNTSFDLHSFIYFWDNDSDRPINETTWIIYVPTADGTHNLTVTASDDTGEMSSPNVIVKTYYFIVDDIEIVVIDPENLLDQTHHIDYGDTFIFTLRIYDKIDNISVEGLIWHNESLNNILGLDITNLTIDEQVFQFTIFASNIGETNLNFQFSKEGSNKHSITVNLSIFRKEGSLSILNTIEAVIYENNLTVEVNLQDELSNNLAILSIFVNGTETEFESLGDFKFRFYFSSKLTPGKGNYTLNIYVESSFYFGSINDSSVFSFEILPISLSLNLIVSSLSVFEGSQVNIVGILQFQNGTPVVSVEIIFTIYIFYKSNTKNVYALVTDFDDIQELSSITNSTGHASISFLMTEEIDHIAITATFSGNVILENISFEFEDIVESIKPSGIPNYVLYSIIAGSLLLMGLISYITYKIIKPKSFEKLLEKIEEQEVTMKLNELCPGVILCIFDQKRGAMPLVSEHSLSYDFSGRTELNVENLMVKISDQSFSSLGFEDHFEGRRLGSITLPPESLFGFIHGLQVENINARGGVENLTLIILTDLEYGSKLLNYSEHLYNQIDQLLLLLKMKSPLKEVREKMNLIRRDATKIILVNIET